MGFDGTTDGAVIWRFEAFLCIKGLFAGGEDEFVAAVGADEGEVRHGECIIHYVIGSGLGMKKELLVWGVERVALVQLKIDERLQGDPWGRNSALKDKGFERVDVVTMYLLFRKSLADGTMLVIDYDAARKLEVLTKAGAVRSRYGAWLEDADGQPLHDPEKLKTYISTELGDIFVAASEI